MEPPSKNLAKRIFTEVDFDNRLMGYRLRKFSGPMPVPLYSMQDIASLLADPYARADYFEIIDWVQTVIVDTELSEQITEAIKTEDSNQSRMNRIRCLMLERLEQSKKII